MRVLVTGNLGYVGSVLVKHLRTVLGPSAELWGYDIGYFARCLTVPPFSSAPEVVLDTQYFGDVRSLRPELLKGVDAIVHLAAISNDPMGTRFSVPTDEINRGATVRLAQIAREAGVKTLVFASSCSVYGAAQGGQPRKETDELNPLTAYARSKIDSEMALRADNAGGLQIRCLRFATACGMSDRLRLDLVLNDFVASALATGEISVLSDGTPWRPLIDVSDMARAIEWALFHSAQEDDFLSVNVGSDDWNFQVSDLANAVAQAIPGTKVSINKEAQKDLRSYRVDFSKWRNLAPQHQPAKSLEKSISEIRDGLQHFGFSDRNFRESSYMRLKALDALISRGEINSSLARSE